MRLLAPRPACLCILTPADIPVADSCFFLFLFLFLFLFQLDLSVF